MASLRQTTQIFDRIIIIIIEKYDEAITNEDENTLLHTLYKKEELAEFWLRTRATHSSLSDRALKLIMSFMRTRFLVNALCEK